MINLAKRCYAINNNLDFNGVLIFSIIREFDRFLVNLELKKFLKTDDDMMKVIQTQIQENSMTTNFLKLTDTEVEYSENFEIDQIEQMCNVITHQTKNITEYDKKYVFTILNVQVVMDYYQIKRLYQDLKSVSQNQIILEAFYKMHVKKSVPEPPKTKEKITSYAPPSKTSLKDIKDDNEEKIVKTELTIIDHIVSFSISPILTVSLFYQVLTYYQFINDDAVKFTVEDDKTILEIPPIIPIDYIFNDTYYMNLVISLINYKSETINHYVTRLIHAIYENKNGVFNTPLNCMMVLFLLFSYFLRYLYETRSLQLLDKFQEWISSVDMQERIINHHIKVYYPDLDNKLMIKIKEDYNFQKNEVSEDVITEIGEKYSNIIPISEKRFADKVFTELENNDTPFDFQFNKSNILDLKTLKKNIKTIQIDEKFFKKDEIDSHSVKITITLLNYSFSEENNFISSAYEQLVKYIENPQGFLYTQKNLPEFIGRLFPFLEENLNTQNFPKDTISTFDYYFKVCELLPDVKSFTHLDILYIVFQIVIPYYYDVYGTETFIDNLLF